MLGRLDLKLLGSERSLVRLVLKLGRVLSDLIGEGLDFRGGLGSFGVPLAHELLELESIGVGLLTVSGEVGGDAVELWIAEGRLISTVVREREKRGEERGRTLVFMASTSATA